MAGAGMIAPGSPIARENLTGICHCDHTQDKKLNVLGLGFGFGFGYGMLNIDQSKNEQCDIKGREDLVQ
ncbi:hypothetical protein BOTCAL_0223g00080 [Botryotinia calthae]|uniref:Uncharacterized protein n=1 Tax=Botryotinia calthae TaxID=38488 RepID=A0A4Y8CY10_9HELO|nr:hypothetical protein BOTCAL_0223g00080 [Botryotinia calthae]